MGLLSDVFLASDAELAMLRPNAGGPEGLLPTAPGKRIDSLKLASLEAILTQRQEDILVLSEAWDDEQRVARAWEDEWVYRFRETLGETLAQLPAEAIDPCVGAWAATEEWRLDGADTPNGRDSLRQWLSAVCEFARRGEREGRSLYIWWCL